VSARRENPDPVRPPSPTASDYARALPVRAFRRVIRWLRSNVFTIPRPAEEGYRVTGLSLDEFRTRLERENFEAGWLLSYEEYSEDLNMRRPSGREDVAGVPLVQMQLHVRGWHEDDSDPEGAFILHPHREVSPLSRRPDLHVRGIGMSTSMGVRSLGSLLNRIPSANPTRIHVSDGTGTEDGSDSATASGGD